MGSGVSRTLYTTPTTDAGNSQYVEKKYDPEKARDCLLCRSR